MSNHLPSILKNIPLAVNRMISSISSSKEIFDEEAPRYQTALNDAGYNHKLEYQKPGEKTKRKRYKKILWFNPPWSANQNTNAGRRFLNLIEKNFPKGSILYPLINRYKVKLSYICLPNMGALISQHNSKILEKIMRCSDASAATSPSVHIPVDVLLAK